jgi:hypothetical protein
MKAELESLDQRMDEMKRDMITFQDTDKIKAEATEKNIRLQKESKILEERMKRLGELLRSTEGEHEKLQVSQTTDINIYEL